MTTQNGQGLLAALEEERIPAVIVGRVTEGKSRILSNGEEIRFLDRPKQDQIYM
jgi:hydrogenase maturation factor